ncbi:MAG: efflux RND transporter periplasmic adaptor subunit [Bacteroidales bacterium]|jgi:RND family efflux transporter MFP subunit|nr:efflux RND transporter periplasmic adaptor subunit [Bacteroidales bacterium]
MKRILFKSILILGMGLFAVSCGSTKDNKEKAVSGTAKVSVNVQKVYARDVEQISEFSASVEAQAVNNISPKSSGRISRIYAEIGDHVSAGQKLAEMESTNLKQAELKMKNDSMEFKREDELYKIGGTSKSDWDAKRLAYRLSATTYSNLLENTILRSPITGIVTARNYDEGDVFNMGTPLYVVQQIRPVKILVNVSETLYPHIKKGMTVDVKLDVYGDEVFKGKVFIVYPTVDVSTRTFPVEVRIENKNERVRPGMFARVLFSYGMARHVVVPDKSVVKLSGAGTRFVYVVENGKIIFRQVELGRRLGYEYEILKGLDSGDEVILEGQNRLINGMEVTPVVAGDSSKVNN